MSIANSVPVSPPLKMVNFLFLDKEEIAILRRIQVLTNNGEHLCVLSNDTIEDELKIPTFTSQRAIQTSRIQTPFPKGSWASFGHRVRTV